MGKSHRADRLAGEIEKIIGMNLINGIKDPRLTSNFVNVTGVTVTADGSFATCYVTVLNATDEVKAEVLEGLYSSKGIFRREMAKAFQIRRIPDLIFKFDEAMEYGKHIDDILKTLPFDEYHAVDPNEEKKEEED